MNKELTEKQKAFCDYYIETLNATEAYKRAGYNEKGARANSARLIAKDSIKQYINQRLKQIESDRIIKPEEIMQYLTRVIKGEEKDQFGLDAPLSERTKAAELAGKRYMMFGNKMSVDTNIGVTILDDIPEDDANE